MGRNRVLSFMSQLSHRDSRTPTPTSSPPHDDLGAPYKPDSTDPSHHATHQPYPPPPQPAAPAPAAAAAAAAAAGPFPTASTPPAPSSPARPDHAPESAHHMNDSPSRSPHGGHGASGSRPLSMVQAYQPPVMDVGQDTIPELQPIFTFLNSHGNKLYQEGYFLKLDDQNSQGRPNPDRTWTECFAQLVGTVLSLWDAAELDAAGDDGEVLPKFINLTDASIKMIESLPTRSNDEQPLQNILSISTAGRNRYLLHFNSHHSLIQWTAGIRLAMFEHATLQEAYTGALIAGKGKTLNNINLIMDRSRFKTEEWVRVRFGAGVPWRRCWCVISPPDEKEYQKLQKDLKKRSAYDRSPVPILKGDIKFYDTKKEGKKQKKAKPIASMTEAYSAYAIYPQAKSLIDASTLVKIEGNITIHSDPPSSTEGFVFVMPEVHPAVSGFEMLLRFMFPTWDTFGLYGRPGRLVASVLDPRSLMFAMPKHRRYGYLEILDVTGLILTDGSATWTEREWRKKLKELTGQRMTAMEEGVKTHGRSASRSSKRLSMGPGAGVAGAARPRVNFAEDSGSVRSSRSMSITQPGLRTDSAPPAADRQRLPSAMANVSGHTRNASDTHIEGPLPIRGHEPVDPSRGLSPQQVARSGLGHDLTPTPERLSSEDERPYQNNTPVRDLENLHRMHTPEPVHAPPAFSHGPSSRPAAKPYHSPELRRANSRLSSTTLAQLAKAGGVAPDHYPEEYGRHAGEEYAGAMPTSGHAEMRGQAVHPHANHPPVGMTANTFGSREVLTSSSPQYNTSPLRQAPAIPPHMNPALQHRSNSPLNQSFFPPGASPPPPDAARPAGFPSDPSRPPIPAQDPRRMPPNAPGAPAPLPLNARNGPPEGPGQQQQQGRGGVGPPISPPEHGGNPADGRRTPPPRGPPLPSLNTSPPIHRKPLPQRMSSLQQDPDEADPGSAASSSGSLQDLVIDESALARVHPPDANQKFAPHPGREIQRQATQRSEASSHYDDADSTTSPDYASTRKSSETQASVDKPRAGILKTVGDVAQHPLPKPAGADNSRYSVPDINFGPTINYAAANAQGGGQGSSAPSALPTPPASQPAASWSSSSQTPPARKSPGDRPGEYTHFRQDSQDTIRRSVAWQPGGVTVPGSSDRPGAISPEQFVNQRAAAAATPIYSHQRSPSGNVLAAGRNTTPTPPLKRTSSYDMLNAAGGHSRSSSVDLLNQRPPSRGAASTLGMAGSTDVTSHLSAREQEHLAKVTGAPLINMATNSRPPQGGNGLVGAIAARERERQQMKDGHSSQAVQHAINQRQQQQQQQQQQQLLQQQQMQQMQQMQQQQYMQQMQQPQFQYHQYAAPQQVPAYGMAMPMGPPGAAPAMYGGMAAMPAAGGRGQPGYQLPPGSGPPQPRPQMGSPQGSFGPQPGWNPQAATVYTQGGGWSKQGPRQAVQQQPQQPQQLQQPQQPQQMGGPFVGNAQPGYASPPPPAGAQQPGTPGSMGRNMMYQGHAF